MRNFILSLFVILIAACTPQGTKSLTIEDYVDSLHSRELHSIRVEPNNRLSKDLIARAVDIYVANQHILMLQGAPTRGGETYAPYFDGYKGQGQKVLWNKNLVLVADPSVQKEIFEGFESLGK